jgi:predicted nucleic acid-binding protein
MSLVLDSSITLAWVYSDETTEPVRQVFNMLSHSGAWVPGLWRLEVANVLEMGVRRKRHDAKFRDATLADLAQLPIQIDVEIDKHAWSATLRLAERHQLTLYDAAYLELALRRSLPLATLDEDVRHAGRGEKMRLLGM